MSKPNGHDPAKTVAAEFLAALAGHEVRAGERYERLMREIQNFRALALGVVSQRTDLERRIAALETAWKKFGERVA